MIHQIRNVNFFLKQSTNLKAWDLIAKNGLHQKHYHVILSKGTEENVRKIKDSLKTADPSIFGPIGPKVKDSIENSDRCKGESACEVPEFEFLSEESSESDQPGPLQYLKGLKAQNENQLLECSGLIAFIFQLKPYYTTIQLVASDQKPSIR